MCCLRPYESKSGKVATIEAAQVWRDDEGDMNKTEKLGCQNSLIYE